MPRSGYVYILMAIGVAMYFLWDRQGPSLRKRLLILLVCTVAEMAILLLLYPLVPNRPPIHRYALTAALYCPMGVFALAGVAAIWVTILWIVGLPMRHFRRRRNMELRKTE